MSASRTFRLHPPTCLPPRMTRSKTQPNSKSQAPLVQGAASVGDTEKTQRAGEEWTVVQRALGGDSDAQSILFARDRIRLYRTAFSLLHNKEDAEDALQDGLLRAHIKLASFQGRAQFSTWLTRIIINSALMNRRKVRTPPQLSLDQILADHEQAGPPVAISEGPDPEQWLAHVENREVLEKRINLLSPPLRSALHLRDIQSLSTREAAKTESIKISVLKSRIFRARKRLMTLLKAKDVNL